MQEFEKYEPSDEGYCGSYIRCNVTALPLRHIYSMVKGGKLRKIGKRPQEMIDFLADYVPPEENHDDKGIEPI